MDTEHGEFRRAGSYEMPTPPAVLRQTLERLCFQHGYSSVQEKLTDIGVEYGAVAHHSVTADSVPLRGRSSKRSEGAKEAWRVRHAIIEYMEQHPDVSRDEASRIVKGSEQRPRTRVIDPEEGPRQRKGERGWDTRIKQKMILAEQAGDPIDWDEARRRVVEDMRKRRRARAANAGAASEPSDALDLQPPVEQGEGQQEAAAA